MMKKISRNNYESYLIDWMEGNLDARTAEELMTFLNANDDIKQEFEEFENIHLEPEKVTFNEKQNLKKTEIIPVGSVSEENYELKFIAYYENDLSFSEKAEVERFAASNPVLKQEFEIFGNLTVSENASIVFNDKENLHQHRKMVPVFWISSVAAVLIILFSILGLVKYDVFNIPESNTEEVAQDILVQNKALSVEPKADKSQTENEKPISVVKVQKKQEIEKQPAIKKTVLPIQQKQETREHEELAMLPPSTKDITLICDEVYCRFKYKDALLDNNQFITPEKHKNVFGKLIAGLFNNTKGRFVPSSSAEKNNEPLVAKIFDGGARILNNFTGTEANVTKYYDNRGNLIAYQFSGGQLQFSKQFKPAAE